MKSRHIRVQGRKWPVFCQAPWPMTDEEKAQAIVHAKKAINDHETKLFAECADPNGATTRDANMAVEIDARLAAAAPDLLAACKNLENDDGSIPEHAWRLVQEAIAKAEGVHKLTESTDD